MIMTNKKYLHEDISDSPEDQEKLKPDEVLMDLPELKDIPRSGKSGKNLENLPGDTTISSADEEGDELFDDDENLNEEDVSPLEKKLLKESFDPSYDTDLPIESLSLDDLDNEGESLEEAGQDKDLFGKDLDDELIEEEDEETEGESEDQQ
jgi:hypothetical protein